MNIRYCHEISLFYFYVLLFYKKLKRYILCIIGAIVRLVTDESTAFEGRVQMFNDNHFEIIIGCVTVSGITEYEESELNASVSAREW